MISKLLLILMSLSSLFGMEKEIRSSDKTVVIRNSSPEQITAVYSFIPEKGVIKSGGIMQGVESRQVILPSQELTIKLPNNIENVKSLILERESGMFGISSDLRVNKSPDYATDIKKKSYKPGFNPVLLIEPEKGPIGYFPYIVRVNQEMGAVEQIAEEVIMQKDLLKFLRSQFPLLQKKLGAQGVRLDTCMLIDAVDIIPISKGAKGNDIDDAKDRIMNQLKEQLNQKVMTNEIYTNATELVQKAYIAVKAKVLLDGYPSVWQSPLSQLIYEGFAWKSKAAMEKDLKEANNTFREYLLASCK